MTGLDSIRNAINEFVNKQIDIAFTHSDSLVDVFSGIALIGVLVQIFQNYKDGGGIWGYISYIPLAILYYHYGDLAHGIFSLFNKVGTVQEETYNPTLFDHYIPEEGGVQEDFSFSLSLLTNALKNAIYSTAGSILLSFLALIATACFIYIKIKTLIKLMLLVFLAPLQIALSFIPKIKDFWIDAVLKAIDVSLYIPCLYIVEYVNRKILEEAFKPTLIQNVSDMGDSMSNMLIGCLFFIIVGALYFSIQGFVGWVMSRAGGVGASGAIKQGIMMVAGKKMGNKNT